jgi:hypothetical protein
MGGDGAAIAASLPAAAREVPRRIRHNCYVAPAAIRRRDALLHIFQPAAGWEAPQEQRANVPDGRFM